MMRMFSTSLQVNPFNADSYLSSCMLSMAWLWMTCTHFKDRPMPEVRCKGASEAQSETGICHRTRIAAHFLLVLKWSPSFQTTRKTRHRRLWKTDVSSVYRRALNFQNTQKIKKKKKKRFLTERNRKKRAKFRGSRLFQATYNIKTEKQTNN